MLFGTQGSMKKVQCPCKVEPDVVHSRGRSILQAADPVYQRPSSPATDCWRHLRVDVGQPTAKLNTRRRRAAVRSRVQIDRRLHLDRSRTALSPSPSAGEGVAVSNAAVAVYWPPFSRCPADIP